MSRCENTFYDGLKIQPFAYYSSYTIQVNYKIISVEKLDIE